MINTGRHKKGVASVNVGAMGKHSPLLIFNRGKRPKKPTFLNAATTEAVDFSRLSLLNKWRWVC